MKKLALSSAVLAALMAGNAHAVLPTIDPANTSTLYIGGASAQRGYIQQLITGTTGLAAADKICDTTQPIWWFADNSNGAAGKNYDAWYCTKSTANTALGSAKAHILIHKRSAGGSDYGVDPIINPHAIGFMDISAGKCTEGATTNGVTAVLCTAPTTLTQVNATPDLGVSDVDPAQFVGLNVTSGFSPVKASDLAKIKVNSTSTVVFGEQVSLKLYKALQEAQKATGQLPSTCVAGDRTEACMPSLSSAVIAALHTGKTYDWDLIQLPIADPVAGTPTTGLYTWTVAHFPAYAPTTSNVHVVRRANGSGTQTQHGIVFLNYPCDSVAAGATTAMNDLGQTEAVEGFVIHEMASAGNVNKALNALDQGVSDPVLAASFTASNGAVVVKGAGDWAGTTPTPRWAVGLNSLEQVTSATTNYEFVKVDGVAPTLANVVAGKYHDWVENTFQYNTSGAHAVTIDVAAVRDAIIAKSAHPAVLSGLNANLTHVFGNGAYLAQPDAAVPSTFYSAANPVNVFSRQPAGIAIDNCRVPTPYNDGVNVPYFGL